MRRRILVVEDNLANRELLGDWLEANDCEVLFAENLKQGFAAFEGQPPDAVLLDVQLGSEDGLVLARWIREQPALRYLPVLAVTAHAMITDRERMIQAGSNACISKPIDFKLLREQMQQWFDATASHQPAR